jgi:hypothetical protein
VVSPSQSAALCVLFSLLAAAVAVAVVAAAAAVAAFFVVPLEIPLHYLVPVYVALSFHDNACICQNRHNKCLLDVMPHSLVDQYKHVPSSRKEWKFIPTYQIIYGSKHIYTIHTAFSFIIFPVSNTAYNKRYSNQSPTANDRIHMHHMCGKISTS